MIKIIILLLKNYNTVLTLAKMEILNKHLGSIIGFGWAFIFPLINLLVMWIAFHFGLKPANISGSASFLWLTLGLLPWYYFSETFISTMNSVIDKPFMVKKIVFNLTLIPLIRVVSSLFMLLFYCLIILLSLFFFKIQPTLNWINAFYYLLCLFALICSVSWFTSAIATIIKDSQHILSALIQVSFWATPIFWSPEKLPEKMHWIIFINPMAYIINGLRSTFLDTNNGIISPFNGLYFWILIFIFSYLGLQFYERSKPYFADIV